MKTVFLALAATIISLCVYGYDFGTSGQQAQVIPMVWKYQDPNLYPGDAFMDTVAKYPSVFWHSIAFLGRFIEAEKLCFALFLITQWAVYFGLIKLAVNLFGNSSGVWMAILATLSPYLHVNAITTHIAILPPYLSHTTAGWAIAIAALSAYLRNRTCLALLAAIFASAFNAVVGASTFALVSWCALRRAKEWLFPGLAVIAVCAAIIIDKTPNPVLAASLKIWWPYHYFSSSWNYEEWSSMISFVLIAIFLTRLSNVDENTRAKIAAILSGIGILLFAGFLAEKTQIRHLLLLQLYRNDSFLIILALVLAAGYMTDKLRDWQAAPIELLVGTCLLWSLCRWGEHGQGTILLPVSAMLLGLGLMKQALIGKSGQFPFHRSEKKIVA